MVTDRNGSKYCTLSSNLAFKPYLITLTLQVVTDEIYKLLESECKLKRAPVPYDATEDDDGTFIFHSDDALSNPDKLLVLIHGSGVVRAGQWSRRWVVMTVAAHSGSGCLMEDSVVLVLFFDNE